MFAEPSLVYPYFHHGFSQEIGQQLVHDINGRESPFHASAVPQFDLGEVDLFMVPEPMSTILEEPLMELDPLFASLLSGEENGVPPIADMASVHCDPMFSEDLIEKSGYKESLFEESDVKLSSELNVNLSVESEVNLLRLHIIFFSGCLFQCLRNFNFFTSSKPATNPRLAICKCLPASILDFSAEISFGPFVSVSQELLLTFFICLSLKLIVNRGHLAFTKCLAKEH